MSACGPSPDDDDHLDSDTIQAAPAPSTTSTLATIVPDSIKADGKLLIGTEASYAPNEMVDPSSQTIVGWDIELGQAIAAKLNLTAVYQNAGFDTIIPGVQSGKYEMGISSFTDTPERQKVVDFVTYYSAGTSWAVLKGNPKHVMPDKACGKNVGVQQGTIQVQDLKKRSDVCVAAGKSPVDMVVHKLQTEVTADLVSGKTDAMLADSPVVGYAADQTNGRLDVLGQAYSTAPYGIAIGKKSGGLKEAVQGVLKELIADGTYMRILNKWGVEEGAIKYPAINAATNG
ncbi:ABC transporter substrate-binding protein [Streptosporangiaceae bacterium NEAU-GS5]|nr:ABC transporter substrate-binding protein [Streptosporangiaceae bacterium NEAU-GS5]